MENTGPFIVLLFIALVICSFMAFIHGISRQDIKWTLWSFTMYVFFVAVIFITVIVTW